MIDKELAEALILAQTKFRPALKTAKNDYLGNSYADLGSCIDAVIDALHDNGIGLIQHTAEHDKGVVISTVFLHRNGAIYEAGTMFVPAAQNTAQAFGSALTYARRYSLMTACGIAPEDDDGNAASRQPSRNETRAATEQEFDKWKNTSVPVDDVWATNTDFRKSAAVSADAPSCAHGMMTLREGKKNGEAYKGYVCPEKDQEQQCKAKWMIWSKSQNTWRFKDGE